MSDCKHENMRVLYPGDWAECPDCHDDTFPASAHAACVCRNCGEMGQCAEDCDGYAVVPSAIFRDGACWHESVVGNGKRWIEIVAIRDDWTVVYHWGVGRWPADGGQSVLNWLPIDEFISRVEGTAPVALEVPDE